MKRLVWVVSICALAGLAAARGQQLKLDVLDKLAAKATDTVNVTLDGSLLAMAAKFLSSKDKEEQELKKLTSSLKGIYVRSFQFSETGVYTEADLNEIRSQVRAGDWKQIVKVKDKSDTSEIYLKYDADRVSGLLVISAEPKGLTVVNIVGPVDLENLSELSGNFGIPKIAGKKGGKSKDGKDDE
ncbi:MAG: DUF4252 domain-containing protein [Acidobacteriota bacterium]|nr:DUF4252 domain-containing protein [Acidobacteriota bacterium]